VGCASAVPPVGSSPRHRRAARRSGARGVPRHARGSASRTGSRERAQGAPALRGDLRGLRDVPGDPPATGVVQAHSAPIAGLFDLGRSPAAPTRRRPWWRGRSATRASSRSCSATSCGGSTPSSSRTSPTAVEGALRPAARGSDLAKAGPAGRQGRACGLGGRLRRTDAEYRERRGDKILHCAHRQRTLVRGLLVAECHSRGARVHRGGLLNGEIVLLARLGGVPAPVNAFLQHRAGSLVRDGAAAGTFDPDKLLDEATSGTV